MVTVYDPDYASVSSSGTITFDGSASSTDAAVITSLSGDFDANIFVERSNDGGSTWQQTTILENDAGNTTFGANWHSQGNRIIVAVGKRRIKIENIDSTSGFTEAVGDEL